MGRKIFESIGVACLFALVPSCGAPGSRDAVETHGRDAAIPWEHVAEVLGIYFEELPVRVAVFGDEKQYLAAAGLDVVLEYGETDFEPIEDSRAQITFSPEAERYAQLGRHIPRVIVDFGGGVRGQLLYWDPTLVQRLRGLGATVPDFETRLDRLLQSFAKLDRERRAIYFDRLDRFYFRHVDDPVRRAGFARLLEQPESQANRPNLIVVLVDTLRADHLGYHGYRRATSPRIDALSEESITLMEHFSHASRTGPSVASLFTGLHPKSHGVVNPLTHHDAKGTLADDRETLAEILTAQGYDCHGRVANLNVGPRFGFAQGFASYEYVGSGAAADVHREAVQILDGVREPFFLYLHYLEPHDPYSAPAAYASRFILPDHRTPIDGSHEQLEAIVDGSFRPRPRDVERLVGLYDQEIRYFDDYFGSLLDSVEERGLLDDTIILFLSDHGEEFLDHGSALHGYTLYDEQLHVPCFVRDPRRTARRIASETRTIDLLPTLLDLLDIPYEGPLQGTSLVPRIDGRADPSPVPILAHASLRAAKTVQAQSLRLDGWKLIETSVPEPRIELYDLTTDPGERTDLSADQPERTRQMLATLREWMESLPAGAGGVVGRGQVSTLYCKTDLDEHVPLDRGTK